MINVGIIGYGYWGPNLVRNFNETKGISVCQVSDLEEKKLQLVRKRYPRIDITTESDEIIYNKSIDAVVIATQVSTHYELALKSLNAGKHVLIEKPMADSSKKCEELIKLANNKNLLLMVDHTFAYTSAVRKIKEMITRGELGRILYYDSVRVNLGLFQHDVNVIWDLAVHDLSILEYLFNKQPLSISATGISHVRDQLENVAYITLFFENSLIAHIHVNWMSPVKIRRTLLGGDKKMIVYDDLDPAEKVKIYDKGIHTFENDESIYNMKVGYRMGDMWAPNLDNTEALFRLTNHFRDCIHGKDEPVTNSLSGLRVVRMMEAATISMGNNGKPEKINTRIL